MTTTALPPFTLPAWPTWARHDAGTSMTHFDQHMSTPQWAGMNRQTNSPSSYQWVKFEFNFTSWGHSQINTGYETQKMHIQAPKICYSGKTLRTKTKD